MLHAWPENACRSSAGEPLPKPGRLREASSSASRNGGRLMTHPFAATADVGVRAGRQALLCAMGPPIAKRIVDCRKCANLTSQGAGRPWSVLDTRGELGFGGMMGAPVGYSSAPVSSSSRSSLAFGFGGMGTLPAGIQSRSVATRSTECWPGNLEGRAKAIPEAQIAETARTTALTGQDDKTRRMLTPFSYLKSSGNVASIQRSPSLVCYQGGGVSCEDYG